MSDEKYGECVSKFLGHYVRTGSIPVRGTNTYLGILICKHLESRASSPTLFAFTPKLHSPRTVNAT